jgi:aryl-alcohol dehydrogenase-like predicted oxidoreductase
MPAPQMGVGCWAWGDDGVWGYKGYDKALTLESIEAAFRASLEEGVTFFDTAEVYGMGESERIIGNIIKGLSAEERSRVQVASKFYPVDPASSLPRINVKKDLLNALDASLARLQLDHVDLYQIHAPLMVENGAAVGDALAEAVISGRCKAVGVSNYNYQASQHLLPTPMPCALRAREILSWAHKGDSPDPPGAGASPGVRRAEAAWHPTG